MTSASHSQSVTSVLRPGTALMWAGLARTTTKLASKTLNTGFQYTLVDSIATCVHRASDSQACRRNNSAVVVPKCRISFRARRGSCQRTQTTTDSLWTSIPQHRACNTSMASPFVSPAGEYHRIGVYLACSSGDHEGNKSRCLWRGTRVHSFPGSGAPVSVDLVPGRLTRTTLPLSSRRGCAVVHDDLLGFLAQSAAPEPLSGAG